VKGTVFLGGTGCDGGRGHGGLHFGVTCQCNQTQLTDGLVISANGAAKDWKLGVKESCHAVHGLVGSLAGGQEDPWVDNDHHEAYCHQCPLKLVSLLLALLLALS